MGTKNQTVDEYPTFVTMTVVDWVDVFTRRVYCDLIIDALKFCQLEKGLIIHNWCIMTNHLHIVLSAKHGKFLAHIIRVFKKYTSKNLIKAIKEEQESRKDWMLEIFRKAGEENNKIKNYKFWQDGNEAKTLQTIEFTRQKLDYIH